MKLLQTLILLVCCVAVPTQANARAQESSTSFADASSQLQAQLEESLAELSALRELIVAEKLPLGRRLSELEAELIRTRAEYQDTTRLLDSRTLDLSNLRSELESRKNQAAYLSNLLSEYLRNFESRLHISELQRHRAALETARLAAEDPSIPDEEAHRAQIELLTLSLERLHESLGGTHFEGTVIDPDGLVQKGTFALVGPVAFFRSADGQHIGMAEQRLGGSLEPTLLPFARIEDTQAAEQLVANGTGVMPLDPSLGNAHKIAETEETFIEHVQKGGPVMIPIFVLAAAALLVALVKWIGMVLLPQPSRKRIRGVLAAIDEHDEAAVQARVRGIRGPVGTMLTTGVEHLREPKELIEEVMYETVLTTRLKLQRMLPFIAICAAAAPLLGLLGTVTGIINTFKLITVFGSGDVKVLSGGISEALITTKFGLIVAIPSLLLHAFLSRKAKGFIGQMESIGVSFVNHVSKAPFARRTTSTATHGDASIGEVDPERLREQVNEILVDMLGPLVDENGARVRQTVP